MNPPDRFPDDDARIPRFREAGDITLDLVHRDARVEDCWLGLSLSEFELLWRLAGTPRQRLSETDLRSVTWRSRLDPQGDGVACDMARMRGKLQRVGLGAIVTCHADGCFSLDAPPGPSAFALAAPVGV